MRGHPSSVKQTGAQLLSPFYCCRGQKCPQCEESMKKLTDKQSKMLRFIKDYMIQNGYCPSTRDIMDGLGYKSTSNVNMMLHALEDKGYIEMPIKGGSRAIKVVGLEVVEGITYGDVLTSLFPNLEVIKEENEEMEITGVSMESWDIDIWVYPKLWDAPFERGIPDEKE